MNIVRRIARQEGERIWSRATAALARDRLIWTIEEPPFTPDGVTYHVGPLERMPAGAHRLYVEGQRRMSSEYAISGRWVVLVNVPSVNMRANQILVEYEYDVGASFVDLSPAMLARRHAPTRDDKKSMERDRAGSIHL